MPATILHFASVFSKEECDLVASLFTKQLPELLEERRIPNLPRMPDDYAVFRVSRLDEDGTLLRTGHIDFILQRLLDTLRAPMHDEQIQTRYAMTSQPTNRRHSQQSSSSPIDGVANNGVRDGGGSSSSKLDSRNAAQRQTPDTDQILARDIFPLGSLPASASEFHASVEFTLMHEFRPSFDRFDWHVDTKPNDGKWRTFNVNIMLSAASDYTGGQLQVGGRNISAQQGDLYLYPASAPHAVHTVASGVRRTLVLALADPVYAASARYVRGGGGGGGTVGRSFSVGITAFVAISAPSSVAVEREHLESLWLTSTSPTATVARTEAAVPLEPCAKLTDTQQTQQLLPTPAAFASNEPVAGLAATTPCVAAKALKHQKTSVRDSVCAACTSTTFSLFPACGLHRVSRNAWLIEAGNASIRRLDLCSLGCPAQVSRQLHVQLLVHSQPSTQGVRDDTALFPTRRGACSHMRSQLASAHLPTRLPGALAPDGSGSPVSTECWPCFLPLTLAVPLIIYVRALRGGRLCKLVATEARTSAAPGETARAERHMHRQ
uniref:Prolyl 4-hydroxylase alpha subunit Fe(2+) 2OG dioxygenase domain-containing protein n=1 Tax=Chrysotila carterae TaxID=13221 RepID=A0A7S4EXB5_CHRCT